MLDLDVAAASTYPPVKLPQGPLERWLFVSVGAVALVRRTTRASSSATTSR